MAGQRNVGRTAASVAGGADEHRAPPQQDELRAVAERVREAFPRPFTTTELVLIDVDPTTLHAFWTIPLSVARRARRTRGAAETMVPLLLRVRALSDGDHSVTATFDIDVVGLQSQVYVTITRPERFYSADIGVVGRGGIFQALVTSNTARLPRLPRNAAQPVARPADADVAPAAGAEPPATAVAPDAPAPPLAVSFPPPPDKPGAYDPVLEPGATNANHMAPTSPTDAAPHVPGAVSAGHPAVPGATPQSPLGPRDRGMPLPFTGPFPLPPSEAGIYDPLPSSAIQSTNDGLGHEGQASEDQASVGGHGPSPHHGSPSPIIAPFPPPPGEAGIYDPHPYTPEGPTAHAVAGEGSTVVVDFGKEAGHGFEPGSDAPDESVNDAVFGWSGADASDWAPSSAVFSAFGAAEAQSAIGDVRIEVELFGRARPGHHLFLLGRRVALRPDGTFSCTHPLAGDDATIAVFLAHGSAAAATSVMAGDAVPPAAGPNGDCGIKGEYERVLELGDDNGDTHDVQLEVNAVLRVSGRIDQEGDVRILGHAITPDAEGRFSAEHPLPHGALFLSALLTAPDRGNDEERR